MGKKIQDFSFGYEFLRRIYFRWYFNHVYYKKVIVTGLENIPNDRPVIIAPNHQNALIDPLALVSKLKIQPVFLARQDAFRPGLITKILTWVKIMPIYRMRDGIESLSKNDEIFNKSMDVLRDKKILCLMAEGNHGNKRRLRPLVKGMFRIALKSQEEYKSQPGVAIVPLGLEYSHYYKFRQTFIINFGKPIEVSDYYEMHMNEPARAVNNLRDKLAERMSEGMLDIQNEEYYDSIYFLQNFYPDALKNKKIKSRQERLDKFAASRQIAKKLNQLAIDNPEKIKQINSLTQQYQKGLQKFKLRDWLFFKSDYSLLKLFIEAIGLLLFLPVFAFGFLHNILMYVLPQKAVKNIKDFQFHSSVIFTLSWLLVPIYFLIIFFITWSISSNSLFAFCYTTAAFLCGVPSFEYYLWVRKWIGKIRYRNLKRNNKTALTELITIRNEIIALMK